MNEEGNEAVVIDLREAVTLSKFKQHLMTCTGLALSQEHKYLVWAFLARNERQVDKSDYS